MDNSINYAGFVDLYVEQTENVDLKECTDTNAAIERVYNHVQAYKAGFDDRHYNFDK